MADAAIIAEASNQGLSLPFLLLTSAYSDEFAASVSYAGPISLPAEFAPFTDPEDTTTTEWRAVMDAHGVPATSFAQGGFLAAQYFITILETIEGDVTRDSFTEAARAMTEPYTGVGFGHDRHRMDLRRRRRAPAERLRMAAHHRAEHADLGVGRSVADR